MPSPFIFIIQSLIGTDNKNLSFTASGGDTEPIYASGYVCVLVGMNLFNYLNNILNNYIFFKNIIKKKKGGGSNYSIV